MEFKIRDCSQDEENISWAIEDVVWPTFNQFAEGSIAVDYDPRFHLVVEKIDDGSLVATIDGIEMQWDGDSKTLPVRGWTEIVEKGISGENIGGEWVAALGTSVLPEYQQFGLSKKLLEEMVRKVKNLGYKGLVAPVRPIYRWRMLDVSLDQYVNARTSSGEHFDPWIRIHERIGGKIIGVCPGSAVFTAPVLDWSDWSQMKLPKGGQIIVPNAINYLEIENGIGTLREDSVWVLHQ